MVELTALQSKSGLEQPSLQRFMKKKQKQWGYSWRNRGIPKPLFTKDIQKNEFPPVTLMDSSDEVT